MIQFNDPRLAVIRETLLELAKEQGGEFSFAVVDGDKHFTVMFRKAFGPADFKPDPNRSRPGFTPNEIR